MMDDIRIKVHDYKAIAEANIDIKGIAVLTGENSSGKSTLSQLTYFGLRSIRDYERNLYVGLFEEWKSVQQSLHRLSMELNIPVERPNGQRANATSDWDGEYQRRKNEFGRYFTLCQNLFGERDLETPFSQKELNHISYSIEHLDNDSSSSEKRQESLTLEQVFNDIESHVDLIETSTLAAISVRPYSVWQSIFSFAFEDGMPDVSFFEDGTLLNDEQSGKVNYLSTIDSVFYTDTPITLFQSDFTPNEQRNDYWSYLRQTMDNHDNAPLGGKDMEVRQAINTIIGGDIQRSTDRFPFAPRYYYRRGADRLSIELKDAATGIKQFAVLQLLLDEGLLNSRTLMIIDEPEAHLHPQWIVEYARILLMINKVLGTKFMIATHSPDFVNALRSIAEKEEQLNDIDFYLSHKHTDSEQYTFRHLGQDIEPVFQSFNIALDRINRYGV